MKRIKVTNGDVWLMLILFILIVVCFNLVNNSYNKAVADCSASHDYNYCKAVMSR